MKKLSNCNPIIVNKDILSTSDYEFMSRERIKEKCECINKQTCIRIAELFDLWKIEEWFNLYQTLNGKTN